MEFVLSVMQCDDSVVWLPSMVWVGRSGVKLSCASPRRLSFGERQAETYPKDWKVRRTMPFQTADWDAHH